MENVVAFLQYALKTSVKMIVMKKKKGREISLFNDLMSSFL